MARPQDPGERRAVDPGFANPQRESQPAGSAASAGSAGSAGEVSRYLEVGRESLT